jgi:2-polyprenyl-3-methyl-5-hydroxy-6-metoxy-1,4-benzoquinol methylase
MEVRNKSKSFELISEWTAKHRPEREPPHQVERYAFFRDNVKGKVLSIGCGEAKVEEYIYIKDNGECDYSACVCGADLDINYLRSAEHRWPNGKFVQHDICKMESLWFLDNEFDTVIIGDVMEHVSPFYHHNLLSNALRVCKPGGQVLITVPNGSCFEDNNTCSIYAKEHCMVMTREVIQDILNPTPAAREWWKTVARATHGFKYSYTMEVSQSKRFIFIQMQNRKGL